MPNVTVKANCWDGSRSKVIIDLGRELPVLEIEPVEARKIDRVISHLKRNRRAYTLAVMFLASALLHAPGAVAATALGGKAAVAAYAASAAKAAGMSGGKNIILLLQKASFWVGMGITIWGIVEAQLDFPGWKGRILKGILGYIGILLVPLIFLELQHSLQVDVWDQIDQGTQAIDQQVATPSSAQPDCGPGMTKAAMANGNMACVKLLK